MKKAEVKELSDKELVERIVAEKANLSKMKLNHAISPLDKPSQITDARKTVARLLTEKRQRELNKQK
ncbi:MAG: 50S ribosomal protein L29 [Paludibacteraceae bacterium]|nr:50S ribosomal protein L29 [Paludibacteraceae bacterium]